jgi:hypothetical protein
MPTSAAQVADAFQRTGCAWILADPRQRDRILAGVTREIDEFIAAYAHRFHATPDPFRLLEENPTKAAAFFQSVTGAPHSIDMRLLIWHLLSGADIVSVSFSYQKGGETMLVVRTETAYGEPAEFTSRDPWDFRLFRHIGILGIGDRPILDGYYALRRP